jgi:hypothetical protein
MKKPTRILSLPVKVLIGRNYHMQFETDIGAMTATEIINACKLTRNEFYHRGRRNGGTGWLLKDTLISKEEKEGEIQRERNAVSGNIKRNSIENDISIPVDFRVECREADKQKNITARELKIRDKEYISALEKMYLSGGMNRMCNGGQGCYSGTY